MFRKFVTYFFPKKIVWATGYPKGILLKAQELRGKRYLSIAVTNVAINSEPNQAIIYHIPIRKVIGIQRSITPFQRWLYPRLGKTLPSYTIKSLKK